MNTDASNVDFINIPQIIERLSMSCIASFEEWSNIFLTWSFTLCKNGLDFNEKSDSVTVLESISSSSTINLSVCCVNKPDGCAFTSLSVLTSSTSSDFALLRRPFFVSIPFWVAWWASVLYKSSFLAAAQSTSSEVFDFHIWFSPGFLMQ